MTVPGAAALWEDLQKTHGSGIVTFPEVLAPAVEVARNGFPIGPVTAHQWAETFMQVRILSSFHRNFYIR